jgi:hypothetical protein
MLANEFGWQNLANRRFSATERKKQKLTLFPAARRAAPPGRPYGKAIAKLPIQPYIDRIRDLA